jgi:hypothetical protein
MGKKTAASKRADAERAGEWYAHEIEGCVISVRAVRTMYQRQDLFASDIMGKRSDGTGVYIQVTAGQDSAVTQRRRKLEAIPWLRSDTVLLLQLRQTEDPANARRKLWFFRVHVYEIPNKFGDKWKWRTLSMAVDVPKEWFKAYKNRE